MAGGLCDDISSDVSPRSSGFTILQSIYRTLLNQYEKYVTASAVSTLHKMEEESENYKYC